MPYVLTGDGKKRLSTWKQPYSIEGCNCPEGMTVENCPVRQKLEQLQKDYDIGYSVLPNGALSYPRWTYNEYHEKSFDVAGIVRDTCDACFAKSRCR